MESQQGEPLPCKNCDDRKCMSCVFREIHDACVDDCPFCCADANQARMDAWEKTMRASAREAAHDAYHAHNEQCGCRTVEHLTEAVADAVIGSIYAEPSEARNA